MATELITLKTTIPQFKNKDLNTATKAIYDAAAAYNVTAQETSKTFAVVLSRVEKNKAYKDDGFKSLAEYAENIGFNKSLAHKLADAGSMIDSENPTIREFSKCADYSKLSMLASEDPADVEKAIKSNELNTSSTQAQVREWKAKNAAKKVEGKAVVLPNWDVSLTILSQSGVSKETKENVPMMNPKEFPERMGGKAVMVSKYDDEHGVSVYVAVFNESTVWTYTATKRAKDSKKASKPDFSKFDDAAFAELLKEAARRGMKVDG